jgi:hypothetical protein
MTSLEISNMSSQDVTVAVKQEGTRVLVHIPSMGRKFIMDAESTPELDALNRSKNLNVTYRVIRG